MMYYNTNTNSSSAVGVGGVGGANSIAAQAANLLGAHQKDYMDQLYNQQQQQ